MIDSQLLELCKELSLLWRQKYLILKEEAEFVIDNNIKDDFLYSKNVQPLKEINDLYDDLRTALYG